MEYPPFAPSAYGFRSIRARARTERRAMKDKVALEKSRLAQRSGWEARQHRMNAPETSALLTSCTPGAAGYQSNSDRFHTDVVGEEYARRQEEHAKRLKAGEYKRLQSTKRDEERWTSMEEKAKQEDDHWQKLREDGLKAKKNESNVSYDILTLQYSQDAGGELQKYQDDQVRYRAAQRTNMLVVKGDTRVNYNIISGEQRPSLKQPQPITKPQSMIDAGAGNNLKGRGNH